MDKPAPQPSRRLCLLGLVFLLTAGCGGRRDTMPPPSRPAERPYLLETIGEFAVARLYADGFEQLSPRERILAFYLSRAAIAGRDIYYDQAGRSNLEVRDLLEEILTHPQHLAPATLEAIHTYLKLFWINNGNHNDRTKRKFVPTFTPDDLIAAAEAAGRSGAQIKLALGETLFAKLRRLQPAIFDPEFEPLLTCKEPPPGQDLLTCSSINYYDGVTLHDIAGFREDHPLNSRLVRRDGRLQEEVYRAGRGSIPPGRYGKELRIVSGFLEKARTHATPEQSEVLGLLIDYFATGDPEMFRRYNIAWVKNAAPLDTVNGFIESYKDPRGRKGSYEGMVTMLDARMARTQRALADLAPYFEAHAPWDARYKRTGFNLPVANAVTLLTSIGDSGPTPAIGVNLPNEDAIRERHGSKSVTLVNVIEAGNRAAAGALIEEFALPEDRPLLDRYGDEVELMQTTLHEVLGHASGKVSDALRGDPSEHLREHFAAIEEARADLVALHLFFDPKLVEIGALSSAEAAETAYRDFILDDLVMLRRVGEGEILEDDHMRATHLIVGYLRDVTRAVEPVVREGKTYLRLADPGAARRGVAELLAEVQRIKSEGDYAAAKALMQRFGLRIDARLRDEVVRRARGAGIPSYVAFVMPDLIPVRDAGGEVIDARVSATADLTMQMLRYSGKLPLE